MSRNGPSRHAPRRRQRSSAIAASGRSRAERARSCGTERPGGSPMPDRVASASSTSAAAGMPHRGFEHVVAVPAVRCAVQAAVAGDELVNAMKIMPASITCIT